LTSTQSSGLPNGCCARCSAKISSSSPTTRHPCTAPSKSNRASAIALGPRVPRLAADFDFEVRICNGPREAVRRLRIRQNDFDATLLGYLVTFLRSSEAAGVADRIPLLHAELGMTFDDDFIERHAAARAPAAVLVERIRGRSHAFALAPQVSMTRPTQPSDNESVKQSPRLRIPRTREPRQLHDIADTLQAGASRASLQVFTGLLVVPSIA
jgi:hypothetical protein